MKRKKTFTLEIPAETRKIMQEWMRFNKTTGLDYDLRGFMYLLEQKWILETTETWLYKIKDDVEIVYED